MSEENSLVSQCPSQPDHIGLHEQTGEVLLLSLYIKSVDRHPDVTFPTRDPAKCKPSTLHIKERSSSFALCGVRNHK